MKARIKHFYEVIAGAILSLLGFSSCEIIEPRVEYGMPHATFKLVGDVTDEDNNPIEGIKVKFRQMLDPEYPQEVETASDKDGKVNTSFTEWPDAENIELTFEDIDGPDNGGRFMPDTLRKKDLSIKFVEDKKSSWHEGTYTISFAAKLRRDYEDFPVEYGMPHASYKIIGSVSDESGNPIPGIDVLWKLWEESYKANTDSEGKFSMEVETFPSESVTLQFTDVDGEANGGEFESQEAQVSLTKTGKGDGKWDEGEYSGEVNVVLKKKGE